MMACIVNNNSTPIERHGLHYLISGVSGQSQRQPRPLGRLTPGVSVRRLQAAGERPRRPRSWRAHLEEPWSGGQTKPIDDEVVHRPTRSPPAGPTVRRGETLHAPARCGKPETFRGRKACAHEEGSPPLPCSAVLRRLYTASGSEAPAVVDLEAIAVREAETAATRCWIGGCIPPRPGKIYGANVFAGHIFISAGYQHRLHAGVLLHIVRDLRPATRFSLI
jgi:hypothetical protein